MEVINNDDLSDGYVSYSEEDEGNANGFDVRYPSLDLSDVEVFSYSLMNSTSTLIDPQDIHGIMDSVMEPLDAIFREADGHVSLAYECLSYIPRQIADKFATSTHALDLSHNRIKDLSFLANFVNLHTIILDKNEQPREMTFPYLPNLNLLWLNNCNIYEMSKWITRIRICCPSIKQLSLMGNPGILSDFNGGSPQEHHDYRMYIISIIPTLEYLDDSPVTDADRIEAKTNRSAYAIPNGPLKFVERFGSSRFLNIFRKTRKTSESADEKQRLTE